VFSIDEEARGFAAVARPDTARLFRRARRHSRRVRVLRVAIPLVLVVGAVATALTVWLNPLRMLPKLPVGAGNLVISGSKLTMVAPKLAGFTRDERRYELSARAAAQDITQPDIVELQGLHALFEMMDRSTVDLAAERGVFDRKRGVLTLSRDIVLKSTGGYEARLAQAEVDVRNGDIVSEQPVEVKMAQGVLTANRLALTRSGEIVRFDGGVVLTLYPDAAERGQAGAPP